MHWVRSRGQHWGGLSVVESVALVASLVLVTGVSAKAHRWMLQAAELHRYRSAMQDITSAVRAMPSKARAQGRTMRLQIETAQRAFRFASLETGPRPYQRIEHTVWLPEGLVVSDVPDRTLSADPKGKCSAFSFAVSAPAHRRTFRVSVDAAGIVQLDEEPAL